MKVVMWNVRGINSPNKQHILKCCILTSKAKLTLVQETKLNQSKIGYLQRKLGYLEWEVVLAVGASGGLGVIWDPRRVTIKHISSNKFRMCLSVRHLSCSINFILFNIYGPISTHLEWNYFIGGDFNVILDLSKKMGRLRREPQALIEFRNWINYHNMIDIRIDNGTFTWNNRRRGFNNIVKRSDRFFF
ncbi:hypothetical protein SUGI_0822720 [Cryptomeria japonica]|nr:hypothetical protein SUGI_0822720 [Cryptomeria japonica]